MAMTDHDLALLLLSRYLRYLTNAHPQLVLIYLMSLALGGNNLCIIEV